MTKRKFLEELEKHLNVLEDSEKQDILNEYKDMIAEKVKHGKTEKEAVADFGNIDELSKEILSAYKINPNYNKSKESTNGEKAKEIVNNSEELIKEGAKKLSQFTRNVIEDVKTSNKEITIEFIFELMIKAIIMLVGFAILRLPFLLIRELGSGILDTAFSPVNHVLIFMWSLLISILYFVTCILIAIIVFKRHFKPIENNTGSKGKKANDKKDMIVPQEKQNVSATKDDHSEIISEKKHTSERNASNKNEGQKTATSVLLTLVKIFVVICFLIPLFFTNLGLVAAMTCFVFLLFKGLNVIGFLIVIIGLMIIFGYLSSLICNLLFNRKRIYFYPFVIGTIFLVFGGILIVDTVTNINYYNSLPNNSFEQNTVVYNEQVSNSTYIHSDYGNREIIINNDLKDGEVKIEITHYKDLTKVRKTNYYYDNNNSINIAIDYIGMNRKNLFNLVISELKQDRVYNYTNFFKGDIKIYANENTSHLIK